MTHSQEPVTIWNQQTYALTVTFRRWSMLASTPNRNIEINSYWGNLSKNWATHLAKLIRHFCMDWLAKHWSGCHRTCCTCFYGPGMWAQQTYFWSTYHARILNGGRLHGGPQKTHKIGGWAPAWDDMWPLHCDYVKITLHSNTDTL